MSDMKFTQVLPRLRVLETRLLDKSKIDRMIDSKSAIDSLKILQETEYSSHITDTKNPGIYEEVLSKELISVYTNLYKICPVKEIIDIMAVKYDYHNLKVLVKGKILNKDFSNMLIPVGITGISKLKYAVENDYYRDLDILMRECLEKTLQDFEINKDPQRIDIILDKYQFKTINKLVKLINHNVIQKYASALADLTNIKTLLRVKKQKKNREFLSDTLVEGGMIDFERFILLLNDSTENIVTKLAYTNYESILKEGIQEYSSTGSVSVIEKLIDNYIMVIMKDAKYITSGPMPVIAYIYAKENEIKQIRTIMVGKLNKISEEVIRERLRDAYV
ncbi:V-type ATP synthase subunit C [uncultured Clostridium sp.]|uniref:V-type ATP synthase subunit C n=1 Tax=uncultured Clostridium sp. TaxID=59620 RepID=UPI00260AE3FF|nr:V-type ATP synthase subunit C [uncultured Clostridium sp.]